MRFVTLSEQLGEKPFLIGEQMTIADCYLFVMLSWAAMQSMRSVATALAAEGQA